MQTLRLESFAWDGGSDRRLLPGQLRLLTIDHRARLHPSKPLLRTRFGRSSDALSYVYLPRRSDKTDLAVKEYSQDSHDMLQILVLRTPSL
jgi:hypothetical protein